MNDKLLTLLMGRCWHEWEGGWSFPGGQHDYKCKKCGLIIPLAMLQDLNLPAPSNPDYSRPADRDEFFAWSTKERPEMWEGFTDWIDAKGERDLSIPAPWLWSKLIPWLFFSDPSRPRDLMAEWLRLDETVERFGWVTCPSCKEGYALRKLGERTEQTIDQCQKCNGSGKVLSEWARYAKEGKNNWH